MKKDLRELLAYDAKNSEEELSISLEKPDIKELLEAGRRRMRVLLNSQGYSFASDKKV